MAKKEKKIKKGEMKKIHGGMRGGIGGPGGDAGGIEVLSEKSCSCGCTSSGTWTGNKKTWTDNKKKK